MKLHAAGSFNLVIAGPFDFRLTVSKPAGWHWSTPKEIFSRGALWTGVYVGGRPVGLKLSNKNHQVKVDLYSSHLVTGREVDELKTAVSRGLGSGEDLTGFYKFARKDPVLSKTVEDLNGMRIGRLDDLFGRVQLAILLQMAPLARSQQMMTDVLEKYGTKLTFDGKTVILWPKPEDIVRAGEGELRTKAKLGYRAKRLVQAANFLKSNPVSLLELGELTEAEALKKLTDIPGIGKYSAGIILGTTSVPVDVWSVVVMSELFFGKTPVNARKDVDSVGKRLKKRWGKWSWMAFVYVLNDLNTLAKSYRLSRLQ